MEKNKKKFRWKVGIFLVIALLLFGIGFVNSEQSSGTSSSSSSNSAGGSSAPHSWEVASTILELPQDEEPESNVIKFGITGP